MKIHMRPPLPPIPPVPPQKPPPTLWLEMQAEELTKAAQQQQTHLKRLYDKRKNRQDLDDDGDSEEREGNYRSNRNLDLLV
jgi:hypothetical protein